MSENKTMTIPGTGNCFPTLFACLIMTAFFLGFGSNPETSHAVAANKIIPIEWTKELSMASLLADMPAVKSQKDLSALLAKPWYASFNIKTSKSNASKTLSSCNDYFSAKEPDLRAQQEPDNNPLMELKIMCEATRLLSQAKPSQYSKIPTNPLDSQLPKKLPKTLAFIDSAIELDRINADRRLVHWADVYPIKKVKNKSAYQSVFYSDGGAQTLAILGRGDFNGDGWEDILVAVKDTVDGGSYFNLRLFVLTVTAQGQWQVIAQY